MLRYSKHARTRMAERGLSRADIEAVHAAPDITYPDGQGNKSLVGESGGKRIRIVVSGTDPEFVITAIDLTEETT